MNGFDRVSSMDTLYRCWQKISTKGAKCGIDGVDISFYRSDLQKNLRSLQTAVVSGSYQPYKENTYTDHKDRQISVFCLDDKIIQTAISECLMSAYSPTKSIHGFIPNRSVFTAKKLLDNAVSMGVSEYSKVDIEHFYSSINCDLLLHKLSLITPDSRFLALIKLLIGVHRAHGTHEIGLSTGSCLSPTLSNLYLADFDHVVDDNSVFYSRYVDDMLVAPAENIELIRVNLAEIGLKINAEKSSSVNAAEGFTYLGFEIKRDVERTIDTALQNGNFALAEELYETQDCDITTSIESSQMSLSSESVKSVKTNYELPNIIRNVVRRCHVVNSIVEKAKNNNYLNFAEKTHLLQIFHCLGEPGAKFIHHVLSGCSDYDYAETQRRINKYSVNNPLGCKKLCERIGIEEGCTCNFNNEKLYPTPIIHAIRVDRTCFIPTTPKDNIGHFKAKNPKDKATDALGYLIELNKKQYEISQQQNIFKEQIEDLFERTNMRELQTPQGLLVKTDDGLFIKVG